tara:strand:+ start:342 stop:638 length:297 start_codon:yes stop_codon:yes gene_type:complete
LNFSIPKKNFSSTLFKSKIYLSKNFKIYYLLNKNKQIGFIVSKQFGSAPKRNLFKRRCRNIFFNNKQKNLSIIIKPLNSNIIKFKDLHSSFNKFFCSI